MKSELTCPTCGSHDISKNGTTRRGKQNYKCRDCNRQFVEDPQWKPKDKDTFGLVNLLLLEKIPLAGIARATGVSESWLQEYVNNCYAAVLQTVNVLPKAKGRLTVQMDELWSFVDHKGNKQWFWSPVGTSAPWACLKFLAISLALLGARLLAGDEPFRIIPFLSRCIKNE
jgi:insertion element IS1 protein InsB